jgi:tetratricopeptide (TPR) repeat protein
MEIPQNQPVKDGRVETSSFWLFLASFFLVPLFIIPSNLIPFQFSKTFLIFLVAIVGTMIWIVARLKEGTLTFPKKPIFWLFLIIPFLTLVSTLASKAKIVSVIGSGYEVGTLAFIVTLFIIMYIVSDLFRTTRSGMYAYLAFFGSFVIVTLFHVIRLLAGPGALSFGILTSNVSSIIGSWNDLGIYFGAGALFSFITLELLRIQGWIKTLFMTFLVVALFMLSVISFSMVWYIMALFALIFFIYNFSFNKATKNATDGTTQRKLPLVSLVVLIVSIVFILAHGNVYQTLSSEPFNISFLNRFGVSNVEVRPSITSTFRIGLKSLKQYPIVGIGPNRFINEWLLTKPAEINSTIFWNTDFNYGFGLIPTFLVTTGPLTFLAWIAFLVLFVMLGFKALFTKRSDPLKDYLTISSFIIALYFWIFSVVYVPSAVLLFLTFFFTGLFLATLRSTDLIKDSSFNFARDPKVSFASVLIFVVLLLGGLISGYEITRRFISVYYYNKALVAANVDGNVDVAQSNLTRAIAFNATDSYYRTLSQLFLVRVNILLSNTQTSSDAVQSQFGSLIGNARAAAQAAVNYDKTNYQNWLGLSQVYGSVVSLKAEGAYDGALSSLNEALRLNPNNPSILLNLAQLEVAHNDLEKAKTYISQALAAKSDYTDAIFYLSQIQASQGDLPNAIKSIEASTQISPNDSSLFFQLGLLRYNNKDYTGAVSAFNQAVVLVPSYANAKYFLGLALSKSGKTNDALKQFEDIKITNPDVKEIDQIISNLKSGKDALAGLQPPANQPEKSTTPPVKEKDATPENNGTSGR